MIRTTTATRNNTLKTKDNKIKFLAVAIAMKWLATRVCQPIDRRDNSDMHKATMLLNKARSMSGSKIDAFTIEQAKCMCTRVYFI